MSLLTLNWVAFQTLLVREIRRFLRIWVQTITPSAINSTLYLLIFGGLIGSRVGQMGGRDYIDFIVPGIIMMTVIVNSYSNVVSSFYSAKFQSHIEELFVSPVHNGVILAGFVAGGVCRGLIVGGTVLCVSLLLTDIEIYSLGLTFSVVVLTSICFSIAGLVNAVYAKSFDDISIVPNFVLTPLTYLGGIFYSIELLPSFWQNLSLINPVLYMINGFRYGMLGIADISVWQAFAVIGIFIVGFASFAMHLLNTGSGIRQ